MQRSVTVTGHGTSAAVPDTAVVRVAVTHRSATVAGAVAEVDSGVTALTRVARGFAERAALASTGLQVWHAADLDGGRSAFEASHQLTVRCPNLPAASALVAGLVAELGDALRVDGVTLEVSDPRSARDAAREAAWADARARATHLAGLDGSALGDLLAVEEGGRGEAPTGKALALGLEPGESTVAVALTATWQLV